MDERSKELSRLSAEESDAWPAVELFESVPVELRELNLDELDPELLEETFDDADPVFSDAFLFDDACESVSASDGVEDSSSSDLSLLSDMSSCTLFRSDSGSYVFTVLDCNKLVLLLCKQTIAPLERHRLSSDKMGLHINGKIRKGARHVSSQARIQAKAYTTNKKGSYSLNDAIAISQTCIIKVKVHSFNEQRRSCRL